MIIVLNSRFRIKRIETLIESINGSIDILNWCPTPF
jgi:hypothetical protein